MDRLARGRPLDVAGLKGLVCAAIALNRDNPAARNAGGASSVTATRPVAKKGAAKKTPAKKKPATKRKPTAKKRA